jgi:hypothetical protein
MMFSKLGIIFKKADVKTKILAMNERFAPAWSV